MPDLRDTARQALRHYDVTVRRLTPAAQSFNTIVRVTAVEGTYALRIGSPLQIHGEGTLHAEATWLDRLRDDGLTVPVVHRTTAGHVGTAVNAGGPGMRVCSMSDWIAGRLMRGRLSAPKVAELGRLAARLHENALAWEPAEPLNVLLADRVLYWRVPNVLASPDLPFHSVFAEALDRAEDVVQSLWRAQPHRPHLLHGDLTPANAVVTRDGTVVPIDFQDLVVGFDVQDIAITLAALRRVPGVPAGTSLAEAFRVGYASVRQWPDHSPELLESLIAARRLHQINLTVNIQGPDRLIDYLKSHADRLQDWLRSGRAA